MLVDDQEDEQRTLLCLACAWLAAFRSICNFCVSYVFRGTEQRLRVHLQSIEVTLCPVLRNHHRDSVIQETVYQPHEVRVVIQHFNAAQNR